MTDPGFVAALPTWGWVLVAALFGLLVGSFLNVVILRLPARMAYFWRQEARDILELEVVDEPRPPGLVREPSHCPSCKHRLAAHDNIPLLGWLWLRGRCRYCHTRISAQYPLVELACGVLSALVITKFGVSFAGGAGLLFVWSLIALAGIDFRTQLLPDSITLPLLWLGLMLALKALYIPLHSAVIGAAVGYLSLWSVYWLFKLLTGKEGMGHGDFKLLAALGAWMGPVAILPIALVSSLLGALIGGGMMLARRHQSGVPMAFGPFIALAGLLWFLAGPALLHAYLGLMGLR